MSTPPAHRRLVPRRPRQSDELDDLEVTKKRIPAAPPADDPGEPDAGDSMLEVTIQQPFDAEELDPTALRQLPPEEDRAPGAGAAVAAAPQGPSLIQRLASEPTAGTSLIDLEPTTLHAPPIKSGIEDRPTAHLSPAEYGLLAAIAEGHEPSRLRYADWLERRGETSRAEMLRLDHALHAMRPDDPRFLPTLQQIRAIAPRVSVDWRSRVSRAPIEGCAAYGVTCPTYWRALPAEADDARRCPACQEKVYYCVTIDLARGRVNQGQPVALDIACERWPRDLERRCDGCGGGVSPQCRFCPHCGRAMTRAQSAD